MSINKSLALFCDGKVIVLQKRGSHSKYGEKYGFWGGSVESSESPEEALRRELIEELNYAPKVLTFWQDYLFQIKSKEITLHLFISNITEELLKSNVSEGDGIITFKLEDVLESNDFDEVDKDIISKLISYFKEIPAFSATSNQKS